MTCTCGHSIRQHDSGGCCQAMRCPCSHLVEEDPERLRIAGEVRAVLARDRQHSAILEELVQATVNTVIDATPAQYVPGTTDFDPAFPAPTKAINSGLSGWNVVSGPVCWLCQVTHPGYACPVMNRLG